MPPLSIILIIVCVYSNQLALVPIRVGLAQFENVFGNVVIITLGREYCMSTMK